MASVVDVLVASVVSRLRRVEDEVRHGEAKDNGGCDVVDLVLE